MFFLFVVLFILQSIAAQSKTTVVRFNEIDDDGDRQITFDELKKWHKTNRIVRSDEELREMIRSKDRNNDGMLNIAEFVTLLLTRSTIDQNEKLFKHVDVNGDGVITQIEAMKAKDDGIEEKIIHEIFRLIDVNNDDKIEFNELTSIVGDSSGAQLQSKVGKRQNLAYQLMTLIDQNFDQKLSLQEVQSFANANNQKNKNGVVEEFKYIDSDRDGFLTIDEIIKEPEKMTALVHFREAPSVSDN